MICLVKDEKNIGDLATTKGWNDLSDFVLNNKSAEMYNSIKLFVKNGETKFPKMVAQQAHKLATNCNDVSIRKTLVNVSNLLEKVSGDVMVTTG